MHQSAVVRLTSKWAGTVLPEKTAPAPATTSPLPSDEW